MILVARAALGAGVVVLMSLLANSKNFIIVGLVPLFPTFALIGNYIVGSQRGPEALKSTLLFGMFSLIPYFIYLLVAYLVVDRLSLVLTLSVATASWTVAALALFFVWKNVAA